MFWFADVMDGTWTVKTSSCVPQKIRKELTSLRSICSFWMFLRLI